MKQKQKTKFLLRLGLLGTAALILSFSPVNACWGSVKCPTDCSDPDNSNQPLPVWKDTSLDTDGDGFRDHFECCASSYTYVNGEQIESDLFDPDIPDLFVVVTKDTNVIEPTTQEEGHILDYVSNDPTWLRVHEIEEVKVGPVFYDPGPDPSNPTPLPENYRRLSPGSMQRVVRLHLSGHTDATDCPIPADLIVGIGNVGTTMSASAGGTVYTRQIERKVRCLYLEAGIIEENTLPPWPGAMRSHIISYIKHTAAHELFHNLSLRYLNLKDKADMREYNKYEYHYNSDRDGHAIMAQRVVGSISKGNVTLNIGKEFIETDKADALNFMTIWVPPPDPPEVP